MLHALHTKVSTLRVFVWVIAAVCWVAVVTAAQLAMVMDGGAPDAWAQSVVKTTGSNFSRDLVLTPDMSCLSMWSATAAALPNTVAAYTAKSGLDMDAVMWSPGSAIETAAMHSASMLYRFLDGCSAINCTMPSKSSAAIRRRVCGGGALRR